MKSSSEVIATVIETHKDRIGTHYRECWKYHAVCLAVLLRDMGVTYPDCEGSGLSPSVNTKELIEKARRQVGHIVDKSMRERLISDLADALEASTRADVATEAKQPEGWSTEDRQESKQEAERRWSRPVMREAEQRYQAGCINGFILGAEWQKARETFISYKAIADEARAERDAALAAIERVRRVVAGHPKCDRYEEDDAISCGWKSAYASVVWALDGATEPARLPVEGESKP